MVEEPHSTIPRQRPCKHGNRQGTKKLKRCHSIEWCKQVGVSNARGVWISYSQWYVGVSSIAKRQKNREVQMSFCTMKDGNDVVVHFKAKVVTTRRWQVEGGDFGKTFTPMAKFNITWIILTLGRPWSWKCIKWTWNWNSWMVNWMWKSTWSNQKGLSKNTRTPCMQVEKIALRIEAI